MEKLIEPVMHLGDMQGLGYFDFFKLGFSHILPHGLDHGLFLLGLFFLSRNLGVLLGQLTLFTLGHSLTLGLGLYGVVAVQMPVVECIIALSLVAVAGENLFRDSLSQWRPWLVLVCGLVHGLGFAHSLEAGLVMRDDVLPILLSYNFGIEIGQLLVVGIAYAAFAPWWSRDWYQDRVARPASLAIAATGMLWLFG